MGRQLPHSAVLAGIVDPWASIEQPVALLVLVVDNASRRSIDRRIGVFCMPVSAQLIGGPLYHARRSSLAPVTSSHRSWRMRYCSVR